MTDRPSTAGRYPPERQRPDAAEPSVQFVMRELGVPLEQAIEIIHVQGFASTVQERAEGALGARFGELRIERDGHILVTVIELTDADRTMLDGIARDLGIPGWVRARTDAPGALRAWHEVKLELIRLQGGSRDVLREWPGPGPRYRQPPFEIRLSADAVDVAAELHERFGDYVELSVGALPYPPGSRPRAAGRERTQHPEADPAQLRIELDGPLTVASGHTVKHALLLTNRTEAAVTVNTNGQLTAAVADPATARAVGGFSGAQRMPLIRFTAEPGGTVRIPLLVGTASFDVELGYAVPPGPWAVFAELDLSDGRTVRTPLLPMTVT